PGAPPPPLPPGQPGGTPYWDPGPEGVLRDNPGGRCYTTERGIDQDGTHTAAGVGHIWTDPGYGGLDHNAGADR
ncbi:MAG: hypothetical protein QOD53_282, partial [Thermoleophilaceae bacterium]|nr:hypothetical protein [Thermoleophilaceae bacterium]